ncbi:unnamed protein product, partial [Sphagnum jensenii]
MAKDNGFRNINVISKTNATHKTNKLHSLIYRWKKYPLTDWGNIKAKEEEKNKKEKKKKKKKKDGDWG